MRILSLFVALVLTGSVVAAEPMNVLFIVSDDLTNNALSVYNAERAKTPHIDALAKQGVTFKRAYCQYPLCNPSRASFLTGLRPDTLRVYENTTQFRANVPDAVSMPQTFRKAGYFVARVGKLYHYGVPAQIGTDGLDDPQSWEQVINPKGFDKEDEDAGRIFSINPKTKSYGGTLSWCASEGNDDQHTDGMTAREIEKLLVSHQAKPFFLACGFFRPHTPYVAPKAYFDSLPLDKIALATVPKDHWNAGPKAAFGSYKPEQDKLTDDLRKKAIQSYQASTHYMDSQVGYVLAALDRLKLKEKTIVVFISDHGYHLGEHGLWQKQSLFENSARVPLLIHDPRSKANGQVSERTVELVDLHATLADLCGLPAPKTDGVSLKALMENPKANWDRPAYTQVKRGPTKGDNNTDNLTAKNGFMGYSVRTERYRYTEWDGGKQGVQLHDLQTDPGELTNLAEKPEHKETVAMMKKLLAKQNSAR